MAESSAGLASGAGPWMSMAGAIVGSIGAFYAAKDQQGSLKSQALTAEDEQFTAMLNARAAEVEAQSILRAGQSEVGRATLTYAQLRASRLAGIGTRGVEAGIGSAAEELATTELAKQLDVLDIDANAVRASGAVRMREQDYKNQSLLAGVSAENLRRTARSINPWLAAGASLLGGASQVAPQFTAARRT